MRKTLVPAAATALVTILAAGACTRPGNGQPQDCGRIDLSHPSSTDASKVNCYNKYHLPPFPAVKLVTVEAKNGSTITKTFQTPGGTHKVTITTETVDASGQKSTSVQQCGEDGAPFDATKGQTFIDRNGRVVLQSC
jgi:hypothetical protein